MRQHQTAEAGLLTGKIPYGRSDAIADDLTAGKVFVLGRRDLARRAALDGFRQGIALAAQTVAEMAADHEMTGLSDAYWPVKVVILWEAERQIYTSPEDLP